MGDVQIDYAKPTATKDVVKKCQWLFFGMVFVKSYIVYKKLNPRKKFYFWNLERMSA